MNFLAYLFMGIPAGNLLVKIGYKKTALWAMAVGVIGLAVQYLSSIVGTDTVLFTMDSSIDRGGVAVPVEFPVSLNFFIYLLGAFICGFCVCMLNTVVNPMLNILGGGGNKGNQLIQAGGALNSLLGDPHPVFRRCAYRFSHQIDDDDRRYSFAMDRYGRLCHSIVIISFVAIPEPHLLKEAKKRHSSTVLGISGIR